ncbi:polycystin-2-like [Montipora capricornis]|uniref:polycystin-2-like n=1 Tax=Montipora capricornis TaxID=246305 RepID=UPI0035F1E458
MFDFVAGYVQVLPNDLSESLKLVRELEENNWLDRYTRAIFSEFAVYNANINLFCVVTLLFEQLPTGSLTAYPSILTLRLFRYVGGERYFVLTCEIVYLLFCAFFVFKEIRMSIKKGREHLRDPWSILEIVLTLLSLSAVGLYFTRMKFTDDALHFMREDRTGFVSFHYTAFLDEWLKCIIGVIVFLSFLKMFRLLRFNRRMSMLQQVLKRCIGQLVSFMFMFSVAFLAFALLASLVLVSTWQVWNILAKLRIADGHSSGQVYFARNEARQSHHWTNLLLHLHGINGVYSPQHVHIHNQRCLYGSSQRRGKNNRMSTR